MGEIIVGIILSVLFGIIPMALYAAALTLFDRYEREPAWLMLGVFMWGFIVAAGTSFILNTVFGVSLFLLSGSEGLANFGTAVISAPLVEETIKGLAVLAVFVYFRHHFDSILDGVIYGSLVGFGFAAAENINYIYNGFLEGGFEGLVFLVFIRAVLIAFLHATLTSFIGIGFAVARLNSGPIRYIAPVLGYATAVFLHAAHNFLASLGNIFFCLVASVFDWIGFLGMFAFILYLVWREGKIMRQQLEEEVRLDTISQAEFDSAVSIGGQLVTRVGAISGGRWRETARFYDLLGDLAFKKYHLHRLGPMHERHTELTIDQLRQQIATLNPAIG